MKENKVFIDTNLWIYLYSDDPKGTVVRNIVDRHFSYVTISAQVLGELFNVLIRKIHKQKEEARDMVSQLAQMFTIVEIKECSVMKALDINIKYRYSYWDSLIIASALESECSVLYTEDMQHGQVIENRLKIINPFR
ncbi:PIN domain-containing protein [Desulfurobacterium sp.]